MKYVLIFCFIISTNDIKAQGKYEFVEDADTLFKVSSMDFENKKYKVSITHVTQKDSAKPNSGLSICSYSVSLYKSGNLIDEIYQKECDAVGSCAGIFYGKKMKKPPFIFSKFGDYEGRIILFNGGDSLIDFLGGNYFLSKKKDLLFSPHYSEIYGFSVFDLRKNKLIFELIDLDFNVDSVSFLKGNYYVFWETKIDGIVEQKIGKIDFEKKKIIEEWWEPLHLLFGEQLKYYNNSLGENCSCGQDP